MKRMERAIRTRRYSSRCEHARGTNRSFVRGIGKKRPPRYLDVVDPARDTSARPYLSRDTCTQDTSCISRRMRTDAARTRMIAPPSDDIPSRHYQIRQQWRPAKSHSAVRVTTTVASIFFTCRFRPVLIFDNPRTPMTIIFHRSPGPPVSFSGLDLSREIPSAIEISSPVPRVGEFSSVRTWNITGARSRCTSGKAFGSGGEGSLFDTLGRQSKLGGP